MADVPFSLAAATALIMLYGYFSSPPDKDYSTISASSSGVMSVQPNSLDPDSCANVEESRVTHVSLDWTVDFDTSTIRGSAAHTFKRKPSVRRLLLDTKNLKIGSVKAADGTPLAHKVLKWQEFGDCLSIDLPQSTATDNTESEIIDNVIVEYATNPSSQALQWLQAEQTAGKEQPYMFSQCQVKVKKPLTVLMSGLSEGPPEDDGNNGLIYKFKQPVPLASYLIAIAIGKLDRRDIGPRTTVWSEPSMVSPAAFEFDQTEQFLQIAERFVGPYVWGRYDILVLPPSFPYGGMENPCITFATPTLICGDKSLASVIAHEIAHSWTGNLVTNVNFEHFWLNEGHTVYLERAIVGDLYGEPYRQLMSQIGFSSLKEEIDHQGHDAEYTKMVPNLDNTDPDDAFSRVPYDKGFTLVYVLEQRVGGKESRSDPVTGRPIPVLVVDVLKNKMTRSKIADIYYDIMLAYLRSYIDKFKYKTLNSEQYKEYFLEYFADKAKAGAFDDIDWQKWFYEPGMPPIIPTYDQTLLKAVTDLVDRWVALPDAAQSTFSALDIAGMKPLQVQAFVTKLFEADALPTWKIELLNSAYGFDTALNNEIKFMWLRVCIKARYEPIIPAALKMVTDQGRMKYTRPLYRDLGGWDAAKQQAIDTFTRNRATMHALTAGFVAKDLGVE